MKELISYSVTFKLNTFITLTTSYRTITRIFYREAMGFLREANINIKHMFDSIRGKQII